MSGDLQPYRSDAANVSHVDFRPLQDQIGPYLPPSINTTTPAGVTVTTQNAVYLRPSSHVLAYVLVPLGCITIIVLVSFLILFILRKSRMDRLRHHLMPLYNFDPMEEEGDWESDLLEEEKQQSLALNVRTFRPLHAALITVADIPPILLSTSVVM